MTTTTDSTSGRPAVFARFLSLIAIASLPVLCGCSAPVEGQPGQDAATPKSDSGEWVTVASLRSDSPPFQDMEGILVSEPFSAKGELRLVLEMPDPGRTDGLLGLIIPAEKATDARAILAAVSDGISVIILGAAPEQIVADLDGTYVFVNSVPASKAWSLEIQAKE